jgi:hypothetical protein
LEHCVCEGCEGAPLIKSHCIEHATERELNAAVSQWRAGKAFNASNATISERLAKLLSRSLEPDQEESPSCGPANFDSAIFVGPARFAGVSFLGPVSFDGATFYAPADFEGPDLASTPISTT